MTGAGGYDRNTSSVDPRLRPRACPYCHGIHGGSPCDVLIGRAEFERRVGMPFIEFVEYLKDQQLRQAEEPHDEW